MLGEEIPQTVGVIPDPPAPPHMAAPGAEEPMLGEEIPQTVGVIPDPPALAALAEEPMLGEEGPQTVGVIPDPPAPAALAAPGQPLAEEPTRGADGPRTAGVIPDDPSVRDFRYYSPPSGSSPKGKRARRVRPGHIPVSPAPAERGYCSVCHEAVGDEDSLRAHSLSRHLPWFLVMGSACLLCRANFITRSALISHVGEHHRGREWLAQPHMVRPAYEHLMDQWVAELARGLCLSQASVRSMSESARQMGAAGPQIVADETDADMLRQYLAQRGVRPEFVGRSLPEGSVAALFYWPGMLRVIGLLAPTRAEPLARFGVEAELDRFMPREALVGPGGPPASTSYAESAQRPVLPLTSAPRLARAAEPLEHTQLRELYYDEGGRVWPVAFDPERLRAQVPEEDRHWVDAHCHLDMVIGRLHLSGAQSNLHGIRAAVGHRGGDSLVVAVSCHMVEVDAHNRIRFLPPAALLYRDARVRFTFGLHPTRAQLLSGKSERRKAMFLLLEAIGQSHDEKVLALGEIGLDYVRGQSDAERENQRVVLEALLQRVSSDAESARIRQMPLVLHVRDAPGSTEASDLALQFMIRFRVEDRRLYRHCFDGTTAQADRWRAEFPEMYFGLSPKVLHRDCNPETRSVFAGLPLDRILMETDSPVLRTAQQVTSPFSVPLLYEWLASIREDCGDLCWVMRRNASDFYLGPPNGLRAQARF